jgi:hypothetical protein
MMNAKPRDLRVRIPPNEFKEYIASAPIIECRGDGANSSHLGLSGPLRGLRSLNRKLDEALLAALPDAAVGTRNKFYRPRKADPPAAASKPLLAACPPGALKVERQRYKIQYASPSVAPAMAAMSTTKAASEASISSCSTVTISEFEAAVRENLTLREALSALRDVLFYEISKREKAEGMCRHFERRIGRAGAVAAHSPAPRVAGTNTGLDKTRHYSIRRSHKQSPLPSSSSSSSLVGMVVQQRRHSGRADAAAAAGAGTWATRAYRP